MGDIILVERERGIKEGDLIEALEASLEDYRPLKRVLLLPPDITRKYSFAGRITALYYNLLKSSCHIDIMPALGTHMKMSKEEINEMFGSSIPEDRFIAHNWRNDVVKIGEIPGDFVNGVSEGIIDEPIEVEINRRLLDKDYDLIISIGQVVPHEVSGMANYTKNIFVGCGGKRTIDKTHLLGAFYGLERILGRIDSPVRKVFDYGEENFLKNIPILYVLTVTTQIDNSSTLWGLFIGRDRKIFEEASELSWEKNITFVERPIKKIVTFLEEREFKSTWLGNKSVYRTRLAIDSGGELIIIAPGVRQFGEDRENDRLIRKYGYAGRDRVIELFRENRDLRENQSVVAHLIHGSSDGKFTITYAVKHLTQEEVEGVNYRYMPLEEAYNKYKPEGAKEGFNITEEGEEFFFIRNPALGLWISRDRFGN
ncbi:MAG TPA: lactate racemase domain-containing protein [bacterium]|nr:lactate racemase domain-containing protein [bacterium]